MLWPGRCHEISNDRAETKGLGHMKPQPAKPVMMQHVKHTAVPAMPCAPHACKGPEDVRQMLRLQVLQNRRSPTLGSANFSTWDASPACAGPPYVDNRNSISHIRCCTAVHSLSDHGSSCIESLSWSNGPCWQKHGHAPSPSKASCNVHRQQRVNC